MQADLLALRQLASVQDAAPANSYPLHGGGWDNFIKLTPEQVKMTTDAAMYFSDEHASTTLGLRLIAGRNFRPDEVSGEGTRRRCIPPVIIVSKDLADGCSPMARHWARRFYAIGARTPSTIIGITDTLQAGHGHLDQRVCVAGR